jgi:DNA-binding beta-propeller fold protein YncE
VSESGTGGACADGAALVNPASVAVSPDGRSVYVASSLSDAVAVFDRDASTGALIQKAGAAGCVSETGSGGACTDGVALDGAIFVAVSQDGRSVYVASNVSDAVAVFDRGAFGVLTQLADTDGCLSDTGTSGECVQLPVLDGALDVRIGGDGLTLFVVSSLDSALVVLDRDGVTGALVPKQGAAGCVSATGSGGACIAGVAMSELNGVAESPDGRTVYAAAGSSDAVAIFDRSGRAYDVDGDGETDPLTDGLLLLRYFFGFRGATLITGALDVVSCTRCTAEQIESFIEETSG